MENQSFNQEKDNVVENKKSKDNQLEWGAHNPRLTDDNFIDRPNKNRINQDQTFTTKIASTDLSQEEAGRSRRGVKEAVNRLD